jgi:alcohol dehydrogenase class IV
MPRNWQFSLPTQIEFGRGAPRRLGGAARPLGQSALLVGYRACPALDEPFARAAKSLRAAGLYLAEFREIEGEPDLAVVDRGADLARAAGAEVIAALGGGAVLDAAKGIALVARCGGVMADYVDANPDPRPAAAALPLVAVPTTAGTGSEATNIAVVSGPSPRAGEACQKMAVAAPALQPKVALVDPELTLACPPELTAACGADALGHAIEACLSRATNPISTALGCRAAGLIVAHLPRAVARPDDLAAREALALAATLAGAAINSSGVTLTHSVAHALGALLHVPHGAAVALATPLNLRYNLETCVAAYAELAAACGIGGAPADRAATFVERIAELLVAVGLPQRIALPAGDRGDWAARLAQNAFASTPTPLRLNPRPIDEPALAHLIADLKMLVEVDADG